MAVVAVSITAVNVGPGSGPGAARQRGPSQAAPAGLLVPAPCGWPPAGPRTTRRTRGSPPGPRLPLPLSFLLPLPSFPSPLPLLLLKAKRGKENFKKAERKFWLYFFKLFFWPRCAARGILVPRSTAGGGGGEDPSPLQWKRGVLTTGPPGKPLVVFFVCLLLFVCLFEISVFGKVSIGHGVSAGSKSCLRGDQSPGHWVLETPTLRSVPPPSLCSVSVLGAVELWGGGRGAAGVSAGAGGPLDSQLYVSQSLLIA